MIEIPKRIQKFPLFMGKYPIHFTVAMVNGKPDFKAVESSNRWKCIKYRLCHLCGEGLDPEIVFIGGEKCEKNRFFMDGPMHEECAMYAAKVCPYLANPMHGHSKLPPKPGYVVHEEVESGRPARIGMFWTDDYQYVAMNGLIFANPWTKTDWTIMPERKDDNAK